MGQTCNLSKKMLEGKKRSSRRSPAGALKIGKGKN